MRNSKVLEMLNKGQLDELKAALQDEIYQESLKGNATAKKRYAAMKKYLNTCSPAREILTKPCEIDFEGTKYAAFCNAFSLALTKESCGELPMCDEPDRYPKVDNLVKFNGEEDTIDFTRVLADAKSKGYKYTKNTIYNNDYLMHFKGSYYRLGLIDVTFGIIDEGKPVTVFKERVRNRPITIVNDIGIAVVMPVRLDEAEEGAVVIEV